MRTALALVMLAVQPLFGADLKERSITNANIGRVALLAPKDWTAVERRHILFGTTLYRLTPPKQDFELELEINDIKHLKMDALTGKNLERYIQSNMVHAAERSIEGRVSPRRFGKRRDGVYARLTDRDKKDAEFLYFTQGVRLLGTNVVLFTLFSNDRDATAVSSALSVIESVSFAPCP